MLPHPPYSPDLAPSNYALFNNIKNGLHDELSPFKEALQEVVHA